MSEVTRGSSIHSRRKGMSGSCDSKDLELTPTISEQQGSATGSISRRTSSLRRSGRRRSLSLNPSYVVAGNNGSRMVDAALRKLEWESSSLENSLFKVRFLWTDSKSQIHYNRIRKGLTIVNHVPRLTELICNKLALLQVLSEYERVFVATKGRAPDMPMSSFIPETYSLTTRRDVLDFLHKYQEGDVWICKPAGLNQGIGIKLVRKTRDLSEELEQSLEMHLQPYTILGTKPLCKVIQKYIRNPLLLNGRKFDIRSYLLVASTSPFLVLWRSGYARLSLYSYTTECENLAVHLTNQFIQKHEDTYEDQKDDTIWTMNQLNEYINQNCQACPGWQPNWIHTVFEEQCERILRHTMKVVIPKLPKEVGCFELLGIDFLIDTDLKIWLLEMNGNPSLSTNCRPLHELLPGVIEDTVNIAIECHRKARKGRPLLPMMHQSKYKVLYSEPISERSPQRLRGSRSQSFSCPMATEKTSSMISSLGWTKTMKTGDVPANVTAYNQSNEECHG
jgi:tubulin--tyrosine ligase like protein 10